MIQDIYGTQRRIRVEGEVVIQTFNHCEETSAEHVMLKIRNLLSAACFDKFDVKVVDRVENMPLVMDANMDEALRTARVRFPGVPVGEKIDKPVQVEHSEPADS